MAELHALASPNGTTPPIDRVSISVAAALSTRFGLHYAGRVVPRVVEQPRTADLPRGPDWLLLWMDAGEARALRLHKGAGFYFLKDVRPADWLRVKASAAALTD